MMDFTFSRFNFQGVWIIFCNFFCCRKQTISRGDFPAVINIFFNSEVFRRDFCGSGDVVCRPSHIAQLLWILHFSDSFSSVLNELLHCFVVASKPCHVEIPSGRSTGFLVLGCSEGIFAATMMLFVGQDTLRNCGAFCVFLIFYSMILNDLLQIFFLSQADHSTLRFPTGDQYDSSFWWVFGGDLYDNDDFVCRPSYVAQLWWILRFPCSIFSGFELFFANNIVAASKPCHVEIFHRRWTNFWFWYVQGIFFAAKEVRFVGQATLRNDDGFYVFHNQFSMVSNDLLQFRLLSQANHVTWRFSTGYQHVS